MSKRYDDTQHTQTPHDCDYVVYWELMKTGSVCMRCSCGRVEQWTQTVAHG